MSSVILAERDVYVVMFVSLAHSIRLTVPSMAGLYCRTLFSDCAMRMTRVPLGMSALTIGATGAVGRHILSLLLGSKDFTKVAEYGRRVTPQTELASQVPSNKLEQKTINFEKIAEEGLQDGKFDVVVLT